MWEIIDLEWNAMVNRARAALRDQERLLQTLEGYRAPPPERVAADWMAARCRLNHALGRLATLAARVRGATAGKAERVVSRLAASARHRPGCYRATRSTPQPAHLRPIPSPPPKRALPSKR